MNTSLKNFLVALFSVLVGMVVNIFIISISASIIPPPDGADLSTSEGLIAAMPLMEPKHFLMPFLAHAIGTLVAVFMAFKIVPDSKLSYALFVAVPFFLGGAYMVNELPAPLWFDIVDLSLAYFPMAWLGAKLAGGLSKSE